MLVTSKDPKSAEDEGMALVTVVLVMLMGVVIVTTVAASVIFTMSANTRNKSTTQSFIAAESGRDAALELVSGTCNFGDFPLVEPDPLAPPEPEPTSLLEYT